MSISGKPFDSILEQDLEEMINNKVPEGKMLDYKKVLPGKSDSDKKEFLADVSSFANASGGDVVYGLEEGSGIPIGLTGLICNPDDEILRLENLVRDGIEPRIPGIKMRAVSLKGSKFAIIIRIAKSWALPHRVKFQRDMNFYSRNSAGKFPLDVPELRSLFLLSESTAERIRSFRAERLSKIISQEINVPIQGSIKTVLHIVPFGAFDPSIRFDVSSLPSILSRLSPIKGFGWSFQHNFDGFMTYSTDPQTGAIYSYLQFFRSGSAEAVVTTIPRIEEGEQIVIHVAFEEELLKSLRNYLSIQKDLSIQPPLVVLLSFIGINGYRFIARAYNAFPEKTYPFNTDALLLPEVIVDSFDLDPADFMKPIFDTIWNAAGMSHSFGYDQNGKRKKN